MVTNEQIRRARPTVDSPLGRFIKGEINRAEYEREVEQKRARERDSAGPADRRAASGS